MTTWTINEQNFTIPPVAQFVTSGKANITNAYSHDPATGNQRQRIEWPDTSWPALELTFGADGQIAEIHWQPRNLMPFDRPVATPPTKP